MATGREIALAALKMEEPPRVPVMAWGGGMWAVYRTGASIREVIDKPEALTRCILDMYEALPFDVVFVTGIDLPRSHRFHNCREHRTCIIFLALAPDISREGKTFRVSGRKNNGPL